MLFKKLNPNVTFKGSKWKSVFFSTWTAGGLFITDIEITVLSVTCSKVHYI